MAIAWQPHALPCCRDRGRPKIRAMKHAHTFSRVLLVAAACAASTLAPRATDEKDDAALAHGRLCTTRFFAGELQPLWDEFDAPMRAALGSLETLTAFRTQAIAQIGTEEQLLDESVQADGEARTYVRKARFSKVPMPIQVIFGFGADGRIGTFAVRPEPTEAPSEHLDYQTKTALRLPFDGEWTVFWGGRTLAQNYHAAVVDQRFAYDILMLKDGASHTGDGKRNEDYHCFGQLLLAPGAGVVVVAVDGIADNVPGEMNPKHAAGNHVILDHGNGEYSLLAHFRNGTLKVKSGEHVESGAPLGECGNSGNSSESHLHYHLQDGPKFHAGAGLPAQFLGYEADGQPVDRGEPVKGQRIRPQTPPPAK
jgi:hypothetical protein